MTTLLKKLTGSGGPSSTDIVKEWNTDIEAAEKELKELRRKGGYEETYFRDEMRKFMNDKAKKWKQSENEKKAEILLTKWKKFQTGDTKLVFKDFTYKDDKREVTEEMGKNTLRAIGTYWSATKARQWAQDLGYKSYVPMTRKKWNKKYGQVSVYTPKHKTQDAHSEYNDILEQDDDYMNLMEGNYRSSSLHDGHYDNNVGWNEGDHGVPIILISSAVVLMIGVFFCVCLIGGVIGWFVGKRSKNIVY